MSEETSVADAPAVQDFAVDEEIRLLLPPLSEEEYLQLATSILASQHADPLVVLAWPGERVLGDGHHRREICTEHGIPYSTRDVQVPSREAALQWVIDNQLGRRNISDERRAYFRGKDYLIYRQQAREAARSPEPAPAATEPAIEELGTEQPEQPTHAAGNDYQTPEQATVVPEPSANGNDYHASEKPTEKVTNKAIASAVADKHDVSEKTIRLDAEYAAAVDLIGLADPERKAQILAGGDIFSRQTVIEESKIRCALCRQLETPVFECQACAEARRQKAEEPRRGRGRPPGSPNKPKGTPPPDREASGVPAPSANGVATFDMTAFEADFGRLVRQVDKIGKPHGAHNGVKAKDLRESLGLWKKELLAWHGKLNRQKVPASCQPR